MTNEEIRVRLKDRLRRLGYGERDMYARLGREVGEAPGQVRKWVTGETETFPATFAAALHLAKIADVRYLLLNDGDGEVRENESAEWIAAMTQRAVAFAEDMVQRELRR